MSTQTSLMNASVQEETESKKEVSSLFLGFDIITIKILQKFYFNENVFPADTTCFYVQQLFSELKSSGLQINLETLRKRLESLVRLNLIDKVDTYPKIYMPVRDVEKIRNLLVRVKEVFL